MTGVAAIVFLLQLLRRADGQVFPGECCPPGRCPAPPSPGCPRRGRLSWQPELFAPSLPSAPRPRRELSVPFGERQGMEAPRKALASGSEQPRYPPVPKAPEMRGALPDCAGLRGVPPGGDSAGAGGRRGSLLRKLHVARGESIAFILGFTICEAFFVGKERLRVQDRSWLLRGVQRGGSRCLSPPVR